MIVNSIEFEAFICVILSVLVVPSLIWNGISPDCEPIKKGVGDVIGDLPRLIHPVYCVLNLGLDFLEPCPMNKLCEGIGRVYRDIGDMRASATNDFIIHVLFGNVKR